MNQSCKLLHPDYLTVCEDGHYWLGGNSKWLGESLENSGSSATVSATITRYMSMTSPDFQPLFPSQSNYKHDLLQLMEDFCAYLKPKKRGSLSLYPMNKALIDYGKDLDVEITTRQLDIPWFKYARPTIDQTVGFLRHALEQDIPVAWLSLHRGRISSMESPQWLIITGLSFEPNGPIHCTYLDNGKERTIDLRLWFQTTLLGGGLIYIDKP